MVFYNDQKWLQMNKVGGDLFTKQSEIVVPDTNSVAFTCYLISWTNLPKRNPFTVRIKMRKSTILYTFFNFFFDIDSLYVVNYTCMNYV